MHEGLFVEHATARTASLALGKIQKWMNGRVTLEIEFKYDFWKFLPTTHYYPAYYITAEWTYWTVPSNGEFSI